jgi:hypothetical protein
MTKTKDEEKEKKDQNSGNSKLSETIEQVKHNKKVVSLIDYAKHNTKDTVAYILLLFGLIWMLFLPLQGGILVGLVVGFYFSKELLGFIKEYNHFVEDQGYAKSIILGGGLLALFILAPGIFLGVAIMVGLKYLFRAD